MSEITNEFLIEKYNTLILVIDDLQSKISKLTKFYEQVKAKYNLYDVEVEKALSEMRTTKSQVIEGISLATTESKISLDKTIADGKDVVKKITAASAYLSTLIKTATEFELSFPAFEERLSKLEEQIKNGLVTTTNYVSFDYDEMQEAVDDEERKDIEAELNELKKEMIQEMNTTRKRK